MSELLTDTQRELRDSLRKFLTQESASEIIRAATEGRAAVGLASKVASFGLFELFESLPEDGGAGGRDLGMIAEETGRVLLPVPLLAQLVGGAWFLRRVMTGARLPELVRRCAEIGAPATATALEQAMKGAGQVHGICGPLSTGSAEQLKLRSGAGDRITGSARFVPVLADARYLLASASSPDGAHCIVFVPLADVPVGAVRRSPEKCLDRTISRERIDFDGVPCIRLEQSIADQLFFAHSIVHANELAGLAARIVAMTNDYVKTRKQFGSPLGAFQAVQHRLADIFLQSEAVSALAGFAAWALDHSTDQVAFAARASLSYALEQAPRILESALQLHGGIGFTWEYDLHLFLRRARMSAALYKFGPQDEAALLAAAAA